MEKNIRLKEKLIKRIKDIDNGELLNQIARIVQFEEKFDEIYIMSPEETEAVEDGIRQIENGQWVSHEDVKKQVDEWLKKPIN